MARTLLDLSLVGTSIASFEVAEDILIQLRGLGSLHKSQVQHARFVVLKSPDIPSILVETAFISNPKEERKLRNPNHQQVLAKSIMAGIHTYFRRKPPPGTRLAARKHTIAWGDTLSGIAKHYQKSPEKLSKNMIEDYLLYLKNNSWCLSNQLNLV